MITQTYKFSRTGGGAARGWLAAVTLAATAMSASAQETVETRVGPLEFTHSFTTGYPTDETIAKLFDEIDFQRAAQSYIWAIPLVSMAQWRYAYQETLGAKNGQIVFLNSYEDVKGGLTFNATTPYALVFIDLEDEPWIVEMPEGEVRGAAHDMWQIGLTQLTKPGKYMFVGPDHDVPGDTGDITVQKVTTNTVFLGIRLVTEDDDERLQMLNSVGIYPFSEADDPNPRGFIRPDGRVWSAAHPRGMEYWQRLSDAVNREPVFERDRFFMAMLAPLGIEKGRDFEPTPRQAEILEQGALVGEAMAKAIDFDKSRLADAHYVDGSRWDIDTTSPPDQRREHYDALDGRASWFYEAVTNDIAMHGDKTGEGQVYLTAYKDADGNWLDGGQNYTLNVPADAPAELFWSLTLYEVDGRDVIHNAYSVTDRSSRMDLLVNDDGSVDLHFGPDAPAGREANWIPTEAGRAFFAMLRLYGPKQPFLDRTWVLPDIERADG